MHQPVTTCDRKFKHSPRCGRFFTHVRDCWLRYFLYIDTIRFRKPWVRSLLICDMRYVCARDTMCVCSQGFKIIKKDERYTSFRRKNWSKSCCPGRPRHSCSSIDDDDDVNAAVSRLRMLQLRPEIGEDLAVAVINRMRLKNDVVNALVTAAEGLDAGEAPLQVVQTIPRMRVEARRCRTCSAGRSQP